MAQITPKGDAARQLLASLPEFSGGDKPVAQLSDAYAQRLATAAQRQLASGVTPSRQAARGHILTSEHKGGATPKLPERPTTYKQIAQTSKQAGVRGGGVSRPSQRVTERLTGERRPLIHHRPPFQGHIPFGDGGEIYTVRTEAEARKQLAYAREEGQQAGMGKWGERVVMQVFDCSKRKWSKVFRSSNGGYGYTAGGILEETDGGSLEAWLMAIINDDGSVMQGKISHICLYEITILPRETAAVKALKERMKHR